MERLRVQLVLPAETVGGRTVMVEAGDPTTGISEPLAAPRRLDPDPPRWLEQACFLHAWLGSAAQNGWLDEGWLWPPHLCGSVRIEAVTWRAYFGRLRLQAMLEEPAGRLDSPLAVSERMINSDPAPPRDIRLAAPDPAGRIRLSLRPSRSLQPAAQ